MKESINNTTSTRNAYLDIVKAFAIICVVAGHCINYGSGYNFYSESLYFDNIVCKIIGSFHMPLFMLISGYLFYFSINRTDFKNLICKKFKSLIIPIALWTIALVGIDVIKSLLANQSVSFIYLIKNYLSAFTGTNYWFLWAVFWCSLAVIIINHFFSDNIIIYLLGLILTFIVPDWILNVYLYKFMYPFFLVGYFFNKNNGVEKVKKYINKISVAVIGILYVGLMFLYNYDSYIYTSKYRLTKENFFPQLYNDVYRFTVGLVGSVLVLLIFKYCCQFLEKNKIILLIGRNTMGIYIISGFINLNILMRVTSGLQSINYFLTIVETIAVIAVSLICTLIIKKSKTLNRLLLGGR